MPSSRLPLGPQDVVQAIKSDTEVSERAHAAVPAERRGASSTNLLVHPDRATRCCTCARSTSRPSATGSVPQMQRVIVAFQPGGSGTLTVAIGDTLQDALDPIVRRPPVRTGRRRRRRPAGEPQQHDRAGAGAPRRDRRGVQGYDEASRTATSPRARRQLAEARELFNQLEDLLNGGPAGGDPARVVAAAGRHTTSTTEPGTTTTTEKGEA